jgi:hypothetical protein
MSRDLEFSDFEYTGEDPHSSEPDKLQIGSDGARFILPRKKRRKSYTALFDTSWDEVISFECCEVHYCTDDLSWPLNEDLPNGYESIASAGLLFLYLMPFGQANFQIWSHFPVEDVPTVRELVEHYLNRPSLPGLAHHGTSAVVKYMYENSEILGRKTANWHDWAKKGPTSKPNPKFRERPPEYIYCKEGMAIDFYGGGEQLEQMATFWPWRVVNSILLGEYEVLYKWHEDSYVFRQQVWVEKDREEFHSLAKSALDAYNAAKDVDELLLIRPWSFPSRLHRTWDKLEPFSSKASRNSFPPIYNFTETDD